MLKVCVVSGSLGNQIYQYIFARCIEENTGNPVYLDQSYIEMTNRQSISGFVLDKAFPHAKLNLVKDKVGLVEWGRILEEQRYVSYKERFPLWFFSRYENITIVRRKDWPIAFQAISKPYQEFLIENDSYDPTIYNLEYPYCYYSGIWVHSGWYHDLKTHQKLKKELKFAEITDPINSAYEKGIQGTRSIALHIRRNDVLLQGRWVGARFYQKSLETLREHLDKNDLGAPTYFVFSDDILWCKNNCKELGFFPKDEIVFVEGNPVGEKNEHIDLNLMSQCKHMIYPDSTFSEAACLLNENNSYIMSDSTLKNTCFEAYCHL